MSLQKVTPFDRDTLKKYNANRLPSIRKKLCHAPFQSLYFGKDGKVTVCCYNRRIIVGSYPEQSLNEIWNGDAIKYLRAEITANTFGTGCDYCVNQLEARNFGGLHARLFDRYASRLTASKSKTIRLLNYVFAFGWQFIKKVLTIEEKIINKQYNVDKDLVLAFPNTLEFELSNTCNLECTMCSGEFSSSIRKNRENLPPLPTFYDESFVKQLEPFMPYLREVKFFGGEPFLIPIYFEIWERLIQINPAVVVHITTNGTILNEKVKKILQNLNVFLIISLDSFERETYEHIRKNANFERVMENLIYFEKIARRKKKIFSITVCPITSNWREIPVMVQSCNRKNIGIYFNTVWFPFELSLRSLSFKELDEIISYYESFSFKVLPIHFVTYENVKLFKGLIQQLKKWQTMLPPDTPQDLTSSPKHENKLESLKDNLIIRALQNIQAQIDSDEAVIDFQSLEALANSAISTKQFIEDYFISLIQALNAYVEEENIIIINESTYGSIGELYNMLSEKLNKTELLEIIIYNDHRHTANYIIKTRFQQIDNPLEFFIKFMPDSISEQPDL